AATGATPITWSVVSGTLPPGLSLNASTGVISGTPTTESTYSFSVRASNAAGNSSNRALVITVISAPVISTASLPNATKGTTYSQTLAATGTAPITWSVVSGALPSGLTLNASTGIISGTPTTESTYAFSVRASNVAGSSTKALVITVISAPIISAASLPNATKDKNYSQTLTATGTAPITWSLKSGSLPDGLSLSSTGVLSGVPTAGGTFTFYAEAANKAGSDSRQFTITVDTRPAITTATLSNGVAGASYYQSLTATGTVPITWSRKSGSLPQGISLSSAGALSGAPVIGGVYTFTAEATNAIGSDAKQFTLTVNAPPIISSYWLPGGNTGIAYSQTLTADSAMPVTWSLASGTLPYGLSLSRSGVLSGEPTVAGNFSFAVRVQNDLGATTRELSIAVNDASASIVINTDSLPGATVGAAYAQTLAATGTGPITWSLVSGELPDGLALSGAGVISGEVGSVEEGIHLFTVRAQDDAGIAEREFSITISSSAMPVIINHQDSLPAGTRGVAYSYAFTAISETPFIWSSQGTLPPGLSLSPVGILSGTPATPGDYTFFVAVKNANNNSEMSMKFTFAILDPAPPEITSTQLPGAVTSVPYYGALTAGGSPPARWSIDAGALPPGLTLDPTTGAISGTSSASGTYTFTVKAENSIGAAAKQFTIVVGARPVMSAASPPGAIFGKKYTHTLAVTGAAPITWSLDSGYLPPGLSLDAATGVISGNPAFDTGTFSFTVRASNAVGSAYQRLHITISNPSDNNGNGDNNGTGDNNGNSDNNGTGAGKEYASGVKVNSLSISGAPVLFIYKASGKGNTAKLTAGVSPANAANKSVRWSSSNPRVASVDANGRVTFKNAEGVVTITATASDGSGVKSAKVINVARNVTAIRTPLTSYYIKKGKNLTLPIALDDATAPNKTIASKLTFYSSDEGTLTVDAKGVVKASKYIWYKSAAEVTVTAANGKSKTIKIYVVPKSKKLKKFKIKGAPKKMAIGQVKQLKFKLTTKTATNLKVKFKSSKPSVISVDKAGKLVAKKKGKAVITVKMGGKTVKTKKITVK
ncbi:MAG: putative Ig domain-containing protein, partial [Clostridiales Family XIII bacterium]|nr:putative Ig domain-containing protein [Clostridiales Family XIII bacterium]